MYALSISFGPTNAIVAFMFKTEERAKAMRAIARVGFDGGEAFTIEDDFGQFGDFVKPNAVLFEDLEQSKAAHIERHLHNMRMQLAANDAVDAEPAFRSAQTRAKLAQMMNGGGVPSFGPIPRQ
jgi:hypothetical protein